MRVLGGTILPIMFVLQKLLQLCFLYVAHRHDSLAMKMAMISHYDQISVLRSQDLQVKSPPAAQTEEQIHHDPAIIQVWAYI